MFSLFSSLGLNKAAKSALRKIPYYASLILIELIHDKSTGKMIVQFSFKNGLEVSALRLFKFVILVQKIGIFQKAC